MTTSPLLHPQDNADDVQSLRTPEAVFALLGMLGDHEHVHSLVTAYPTWDALAAASSADLGHHVGLTGARLQIPRDLPPMPPLPAGVNMHTRYSIDFPRGARELPTGPVALFVAGTLPTEPALAIGGAENPTMTGSEIAKAAALAAAVDQVPVVAQVTPGCALSALRTAVDAGGRVVAVMPHGFAVTSNHQMLLEQVIAQGGAVVTQELPGTTMTESAIDRASRLVAGLARAVVLAETGVHRAAGMALASAAVATGRYLIVPAPDAPAQSGRYIPPSAFGSAVFASAKEWSPEYYGTGARIEHRTANGLPPADHVVNNPAELAAAITIGCRPEPHGG